MAEADAVTTPKPRIAIIGAGMAGASCARRLADAGADVHLFEKSRRVGGRMATRRILWSDEDDVEREAQFDHGAPGFSVHSAAFAKSVDRFRQSGDLLRWTPRLARGSFIPLDAFESWTPNPDMPELCRQLIGASPITFGLAIDALDRDHAGWRVMWLGETLGSGFTQVVLALPPAQAADLLRAHRLDWAQLGWQQRMLACWTLMGVADRPSQALNWDVAWPLSGPLAWLIRNECKPGRASADGRVHWVAHANPAWSDTHLEAPNDTVHAALLTALEDALGHAPTWRTSQVHRWRHASVARPAASGLQPYRFDAELGLGVCGDYLGGAGVEGAWASGDALALRIVRDCGLDIDTISDTRRDAPQAPRRQSPRHHDRNPS
ncbi:MAG: FAD-dependent oxidoreductase [Burkholderiaceae bacterium]